MKALGLVMLVAAAVLVPVGTARAAAPATQLVQFSIDGSSWSNTYTGSLFGGVLLVPGTSTERAFYVRSVADLPARLQVTLYDVRSSDAAVADALSLTVSTPALPGSAVPVTRAQPCATLTSGQMLQAGDSIRLDTVAAMGDLDGTTGQNGSVSFKLEVTLSDTESAAPAPDTCPGPDHVDRGTVVGFPGGSARGGADTAGSGSGSSGPSAVATPAPAVVSPEPDPAFRVLVANTARLYQEDTVALWLVLAVLGALIFLLVRSRRRRADDDDAASPYPPTPQNGTAR